MTSTEQLFIAIKEGDKFKVERIIKSYPDWLNQVAPDGWSPLKCAIYHKQKSIASLLVLKGARL